MALIITHSNTATDSVPGRLRQHLLAKGFQMDKLITSPNYRYELVIAMTPADLTQPDSFTGATLAAFGTALEDFTECDFRLVDATVVDKHYSIRIAAIGKGKSGKKDKAHQEPPVSVKTTDGKVVDVPKDLYDAVKELQADGVDVHQLAQELAKDPDSAMAKALSDAAAKKPTKNGQKPA